jgi:hypothetical protein
MGAMSYRVIVVDLFHAYDPDETWVLGDYETLDAAVTVAKHKIDRRSSMLSRRRAVVEQSPRSACSLSF